MNEAELKSAITDYLQFLMNQGKLYFDRLNSGEFIEVRGNSRRRIIGCRKGTADFFVLIKSRIIFIEVKGDKGRSSPEQGAFKVMVEEQGAEYLVIRDLEALMEVLR